jgi:hypothetical protein
MLRVSACSGPEHHVYANHAGGATVIVREHSGSRSSSGLPWRTEYGSTEQRDYAARWTTHHRGHYAVQPVPGNTCVSECVPDSKGRSERTGSVGPHRSVNVVLRL